MNFTNKYRWRIYLAWVVPTFFIWFFLGFYAWRSDPETPGGLYIFTALIAWATVHFLTAIILAIILAIWRWRVEATSN